MGETSLVLSWIIGMTILGLAYSQATSTQETDHCIEGVQVPEVDDSMKQWIEDGLAAHNEVRKKHGVPPLTLNLELCKSAQWTSNAHVNGAKGHTSKMAEAGVTKMKCGENLFAAGFESPPEEPISVTAEEAVQAWYKEIKDYDWGKHEFSMSTGHFTQVIWKDTHEMCMVFARDSSGSDIYVTAQYYPPGNYEGRFAENVPRPLSAAALRSSLLSFALVLVSMF